MFEPLQKAAAFLFLALLVMVGLPGEASAQGTRITKVYVPNNKPGTVLYDTESQPAQVLVKDKKSVFTVMAESSTKEWVVLSKMSADPDEASGTNEEVFLMNVLQKKVVSHPEHGAKARVISIEIQAGTENVLWFLDDKTVTTSIEKLTAGSLGARAGKLEDNPSILVGRTYTLTTQLDPGIIETTGGMLLGTSDKLGLSTARKASWRPSKRTRDKALYILDQIIRYEDKGRTPVWKVLDVLFVDLDQFPAGAMQQNGNNAFCNRVSLGENDDGVIGVFPSKNAENGVKPYKAWLADVKTRKFVALDPAAVRCKEWPVERD